MDTKASAAKPEAEEKKQKHKPPSRLRRDFLRAKAYWESKWRTGTVSKKDEAESDESKGEPSRTKRNIETGTEGDVKHKTGKSVWKRISKFTKIGKKKSDKAELHQAELVLGEVSSTTGEENAANQGDTEAGDRDGLNEKKKKGGIGQVYQDLEDNMRLSRLEEERNLILALRHLVRNLHEGGGCIAFPTPQAVDRIQLRCSNLPTEPRQLLELVERVFCRRGEYLNLKDIYEDFVRSHGRVVFDNRQGWPQCYALIRHP